jgi:hypothetical protein
MNQKKNERLTTNSRLIVAVSLIAIFIFVGAVACNESTTPETRTKEKENISNDSLIERGRYLVTIMACHDCHSPKKMGPHGPELDSTRLLSGHPASMPVANIDGGSLKDWVLFNQNLTAIAGPWGVSFTANLTPDETGIGNWSEDQFFTAIRKGKYKGMENGRNLLPPMPWEMYRNANDEDLKAIFSYLQSLPPISNTVPAPIPPDEMQKMAQ